MTPEPSHSPLTTRPWFPLVPFMLVLLAAAVGIAGRLTAPTIHPRLAFPHFDESFADMEKEAALLKRAEKEFPFAVVEALRLSQRHRLEDRALGPLRLYTRRYAPFQDDPTPDFIDDRRYTHTFGQLILSDPLRHRFTLDGSFDEAASVFDELAWRLHCDAKLLRERFHPLIRTGTSVHQLHSFGEPIALAEAEAPLQSVPPRRADAIRSYEAAALLAGQYSRLASWHHRRFGEEHEPGDLQRAIEHLRKAEKLTDWRQRPREWARIQGHLADCTALLGFGREAAETLREAITAAGRHPDSEPPDPPTPPSRFSPAGRSYTIDSEPPDPGWVLRAQLDAVLADRAPYVAAEGAMQRRLDTADGGFVSGIGVFQPGEVEQRKVIANALFSQARYAEAEAMFRTFLPNHEHPAGRDLREELLGCTSLADVLEAQGRHAEAEKHYRNILADCISLRGPEHNDTLRAARELARCLHAQEKDAEALTFARLALDGWEKTLGAGHPRTVLAQQLVKEIEHPETPAPLPPPPVTPPSPRFR